MASTRRSFTLKEKVDIISRLKNGESNVGLCREFNVSHSTVSSIWKNRSKIMEYFQIRSLKTKKNRKPIHQDVASALLAWFKDQNQSVPVSGRLLREKANHLARLLGKTNFQCSESWIYRFRQRHGIAAGKVCAKPASVSENYCDNNRLKTESPKLTEENIDSPSNNIWIADEKDNQDEIENPEEVKLEHEEVMLEEEREEKYSNNINVTQENVPTWVREVETRRLALEERTAAALEKMADSISSMAGAMERMSQTVASLVERRISLEDIMK